MLNTTSNLFQVNQQQQAREKKGWTSVLTHKQQVSTIHRQSADEDNTLSALGSKDVPNYLLEFIRHFFKDRVLIYATDDSRKSYVV